MNDPRNEQTAHEVVIERRHRSSLFVGLLVCSFVLSVVVVGGGGGGGGGVSDEFVRSRSKFAHSLTHSLTHLLTH